MAQALWEDWNFPTHAGWVVGPWWRSSGWSSAWRRSCSPFTGLSTWLYKRGRRKRRRQAAAAAAA